MAADEFAVRLRRAILTYESQIGHRVPYRELGRLIATAEGRAKPYATATVSEWVQGRSEPTLATIQAIGSVFGINASVLAFGEVEPTDEGRARYAAYRAREAEQATARDASERAAGAHPSPPKRPGKPRR